MKPSATLQQLRQNLRGVLGELRLVRLRGERASLCLQTVTAVVLAVAMADLLGLKDRWWVALSAYAVWRADWPVVLRRCLERMAGTVAGALLGLWLGSVLWPHDGLIVLALFAIAWLGIYAMIGSRWAYSWILGTVTALMVLAEAHGAGALPAFAGERMLDVAVGIGSTLAVALLWKLRPRHAETLSLARAAKLATPPPATLAWRRRKAWQALQGALSVAVLAGLHLWHALPSLPQAMVSVVAILLVPWPSLQQGSAAREIHARMLNRVLGCLCAALLATPLLPLIGHQPAACLLVLAVGVWLAAHIQAGAAQVSYIGTQFGVGFIMVFVQDHAWSPDASMAWTRLGGIVLALLVLSLVMAMAGRGRQPS